MTKTPKPLLRKKTVRDIAEASLTREKAAQQLLKSCLETASLVTPKDKLRPPVLAIMISPELAFAICETFGWPPEIVSSAHAAAKGSQEELNESTSL